MRRSTTGHHCRNRCKLASLTGSFSGRDLNCTATRPREARDTPAMALALTMVEWGSTRNKPGPALHVAPLRTADQWFAVGAVTTRVYLQGRAPVPRAQAPVRLHQGALPKLGEEHGAARHAVRAVEPVDGVPTIAGGPGMSASAAHPMGERRPQATSPSNLRSANQRPGWRVCASCSNNGSRDAYSADLPFTVAWFGYRLRPLHLPPLQKVALGRRTGCAFNRSVAHAGQ